MRENRYRNPPLYIVTLTGVAFWMKSRRASRELYEEHPCKGI
jgi:hypothetical protein